MRRYAIITNKVVSSIEALSEEEVESRSRNVEMIIDIEDMVPEPKIGWVINGNQLELPQNTSDREAFEIALNRKKSEFGEELAKNAVDRIGARNKILNKSGTQVMALLTALIGVKSLLETGALGTARSSCAQLKPVYTEYSDIFDIVIEEINNFENNFGL